MSRIAEIRERVEKATLGPWCHVRIRPDRPPRKCETITQVLPATKVKRRSYGKTILRHEAEWLMYPSDYKFIAHSREDIPYLLARLEAAEKVLERIATAPLGFVGVGGVGLACPHCLDRAELARAALKED